MIKQFTNKQLLDKTEEIGGIIPNKGKYLIIGVQSLEDEFNVFDDKFYVYNGNNFVMSSTGTTNAGKTALKTFDKYSKFFLICSTKANNIIFSTF